MLKKILWSSIFIAFLLGGCGRQAYQQPATGSKFGTPPPASIYKQEIKNHFNATLKDPYSAKYIFEVPVKAYANYWLGGKQKYWQGWAVVVTVNAKNSYGGYIGGKPYTFIFDKNKINSFFAEDDMYMVKLAK